MTCRECLLGETIGMEGTSGSTAFPRGSGSEPPLGLCHANGESLSTFGNRIGLTCAA